MVGPRPGGAGPGGACAVAVAAAAAAAVECDFDDVCFATFAAAVLDIATDAGCWYLAPPQTAAVVC